MTVIARHQEGVTLNPLEYILGRDGLIMYFMDKLDAIAFMQRQMNNPILDEQVLEGMGIYLEEI